MKNITEQNAPEIIDVVSEFDYSTQNDSYNEYFKKWRKDKSNQYAYNTVVNRKESVFIEGQGFINKSISENESNILGKTLYIIGIVVLIIVFTENFLGKLCVQLLEFLGVNIHNSFINLTIYGGCHEIVIFLITITLIKLIVPLIIMRRKLKMPSKLKYPCILNHPSELIGAIAVTLIVSAVMSIPSAYTYETKEIYNFFKAYNADVSVWGQGEFLVYTIFDIIIVSVLSEALFRGGMFNALRQYGDLYAIIITSIISGVITQNLREIPGAILISMVASVGMLRSGTIFTAVSVKIVYKMYVLAMAIIEVDSSDNMFLIKNFFILTAFLTGVIIFGIIYFGNSRNKRKAFAEVKTYISLKRKLIIACKTLPLVSGVFICLLASIVVIFI